MADDLDAFFDEVDEAAMEAVQEEEEAQPPTKKQKTTSDGVKHKRPKGIVVAKSASAVVAASPAAPPAEASPRTQAAVVGPSLPPPPPPPPAAAATTTAKQQSQSQQQQQDSHRKRSAARRGAAGDTWVDPTLDDWPENDYRIFVGNLSPDVQDPQLYDHFNKYKSLAMVKIVKDAKTGNSKGFGFVSLLDPLECAKAIREMDQTWLSSRPIRVKRSDWKDRDMKQVRKHNKRKEKQKKKFMGGSVY